MAALRPFMAVFMFVTPSVVLADGRVALVIGNSAYSEASRLPNPVNDATDVSAALERIGFDVETRLDASRQDVSEALRAFARRSTGAEVALVFYAGHGLEVDGSNYLVPVDAQLAVDTDVLFEAVSVDDVVASIVGSSLRIVILDACRNNPLVQSMDRTRPQRALNPGSFADLDEDLLQGGETLVAYAAAAGSTASDGTGRNSPYTTALLAHLEEPLEIHHMFRSVKRQVLEHTNGRQRPHEYSSVFNEHSLVTDVPLPTIYSELRIDRLVKLANERDLQAQTELGERYEQGRDVRQDDKEALRWYRTAAEQGDARGQEEVGDMFRDGRGVPQDYGQALHWYRQAADQGYAGAQNDLGTLYTHGRGVQRDDEEALHWYRQAADQGDALGQYNLGTMYREGRGGVEQDYAEAVKLFQLAEASGDRIAQRRAKADLGELYMEGQGVPQDPTRAVSLFREAIELAEPGEAPGQNGLGAAYLNGRGVERSDGDAVQWFRAAAEWGDAAGQNNLGVMYLIGRGVRSQDLGQAAFWFRRAADQKSGDAQHNLGFMYENGLGIPRAEREQAICLYRLAAQQDHAEARERLDRMRGATSSADHCADAGGVEMDPGRVRRHP